MSNLSAEKKVVDADYVIALFGVGKELSRDDIEVLIARIATLETQVDAASPDLIKSLTKQRDEWAGIAGTHAGTIELLHRRVIEARDLFTTMREERIANDEISGRSQREADEFIRVTGDLAAVPLTVEGEQK